MSSTHAPFFAAHNKRGSHASRQGNPGACHCLPGRRRPSRPSAPTCTAALRLPSPLCCISSSCRSAKRRPVGGSKLARSIGSSRACRHRTDKKAGCDVWEALGAGRIYDSALALQQSHTMTSTIRQGRWCQVRPQARSHGPAAACGPTQAMPEALNSAPPLGVCGSKPAAAHPRGT